MHKPITDTLRELNAGKFVEQLSEAMAELVRACIVTGKAGTLNISLKLKPAKGSDTVMTIEQDYKLKAPVFEQPQQFFFVTQGDTLVCENPEQRPLPFRDARSEAPPAPIAAVGFGETLDPSTGEIRRAGP